MTVTIDSNVPVPTGIGLGAGRKYPFPEMKVGDSFQISSEMDWKAVSNAAFAWGRTNGDRKFSVRKYEGGHRCWRVK